jgi:hypothetical protein
MCCTVVINLVVAGCDKRGDHVRGDRIDRRCRLIFPVAYGAALSIAVAMALVLQ